jgi:GNAT superfamily N-acetyltransferase
MNYELVPLATKDDWQAMHRLRRAVLFTPERHPGINYSEDHPDDRKPGNRPFVLRYAGDAIGTFRLDRRGNDGIVRLVAIHEDSQRRGHGRAMMDLMESEARRSGMTGLLVNSAPDAVGFYRRLGWTEEVWDAVELAGLSVAAIQMVKPLSIRA